jgi:glycosyltransferase involved in cell wall biosynthesis
MRIAVLTTDNREHYRTYECTEPSFGTAPEALLHGFVSIPEVEIHTISCLQEPVESPEKLAPNIWYHGLHVSKWGWMRTWYSGCIRAVRRKLAEIKPDIVHGQGTERDCAISAALSGWPNVITIHGNMAELARLYRARPLSFDWCAGQLENWTIPRSHGVLCNSKYTEALVRKRAKKTWPVANPVREIFFGDAVPPAKKNKRPLILNVGVISPRKRQLEILNSATQWHAQGLSFDLEFVGACDGSDDYQRAFLDAIRRAEAAGYAKFSGLVFGETLVRKFDEADALLHFPSEEAFGLVVAEALARNLKIFGSRLGGIVDICEGIDDAELIDFEDWSRLGIEVAGWLTAGAPRAERASQIIRQRYHPRKVAEQHIAIYREVLDE